MRVNRNNGWQISESWNDGSWSSLPAQESTSKLSMGWKTVGSQVWVFEELEVAHFALKTSSVVCNHCWDMALKCRYFGGFSKQLPVMVLGVTAPLGNDSCILNTCSHVETAKHAAHLRLWLTHESWTLRWQVFLFPASVTWALCYVIHRVPTNLQEHWVTHCC